MAASKTKDGYLVTAYGLFWDRHEVVWHPGGGNAWQLLGHNSGAQDKTRLVCDFRRAGGFYVLWNEYRAVYVGLARGSQGLFSRLRVHDTSKSEDWDRFSWFCIDDVIKNDRHTGWALTQAREEISAVTDRILVRDAEALLILNLGTYKTGYQNRMSFQNAQEWKQVTYMDYAPDGLMRKVSPSFVNRRLLADWDK